MGRYGFESFVRKCVTILNPYRSPRQSKGVRFLLNFLLTSTVSYLQALTGSVPADSCAFIAWRPRLTNLRVGFSRARDCLVYWSSVSRWIWTFFLLRLISPWSFIWTICWVRCNFWYALLSTHYFLLRHIKITSFLVTKIATPFS